MRAVGRSGYDHVVPDDDCSDIEEYILRSGAAPPTEFMRPHFPRWRSHLRENGVKRVSRHDALSSNLMVLLIKNTTPKEFQDQHALHNIRNTLCRQGAPTFRKRGWKMRLQLNPEASSRHDVPTERRPGRRAQGLE